jgi:hypothetical protein
MNREENKKMSNTPKARKAKRLKALFLAVAMLLGIVPLTAVAGAANDVTGTVTDGSNPIESVVVHIYAVADVTFDDSLGNGTTSATGAFTISGIDDGDYVLTFTLTGFTGEPFPVTVDGATENVGEIVLTPVFTISGVVSNPLPIYGTSGNLAGASVQLKNTSGNVGTPVLTNASGEFTTAAVVAGAYTIEVSLDDFRQVEPLSVPVTDSNVTTANVTLLREVKFISATKFGGTPNDTPSTHIDLAFDHRPTTLATSNVSLSGDLVAGALTTPVTDEIRVAIASGTWADGASITVTLTTPNGYWIDPLSRIALLDGAASGPVTCEYCGTLNNVVNDTHCNCYYNHGNIMPTGAVWGFNDFNGVGFEPTSGQGHHLAGQRGVQLEHSTDSWEVSGNDLIFMPPAVDWRAILIQTGAAAGGTADFWTNGFDPTPGEMYKLTIGVSVKAGTEPGAVRIIPNAARDNNHLSPSVADLNLDNEVRRIEVTWIQGTGSDGGNIQINNMQTQKGFIIHYLWIEEIETYDVTGLVVEDDDGAEVPVEDARVELFKGSTSEGFVQTEADGTFELEDVPVGSYTLTVSKTDYVTQTNIPVNVVNQNVVVPNIKLVASEFGTCEYCEFPYDGEGKCNCDIDHGKTVPLGAWGFASFEDVTFTGAGVPTQENQYFAGNVGVQRMDYSDSSWRVSGRDLVFTTEAAYKGIAIMTGSNAGGNNFYWDADNGFNPTPGKEYKITIGATVKDGTGMGTLRIKPNDKDAQDLVFTDDVSSSIKDFTHSWIQGDSTTGGNLIIDNHTATRGFIIHYLWIEEVPPLALTFVEAVGDPDDFVDAADVKSGTAQEQYVTSEEYTFKVGPGEGPLTAKTLNYDIWIPATGAASAVLKFNNDVTAVRTSGGSTYNIAGSGSNTITITNVTERTFFTITNENDAEDKLVISIAPCVGVLVEVIGALPVDTVKAVFTNIAPRIHDAAPRDNLAAVGRWLEVLEMSPTTKVDITVDNSKSERDYLVGGADKVGETNVYTKAFAANGMNIITVLFWDSLELTLVEAVGDPTDFVDAEDVKMGTAQEQYVTSSDFTFKVGPGEGPLTAKTLNYDIWVPATGAASAVLRFNNNVTAVRTSGGSTYTIAGDGTNAITITNVTERTFFTITNVNDSEQKLVISIAPCVGVLVEVIGAFPADVVTGVFTNIGGENQTTTRNLRQLGKWLEVLEMSPATKADITVTTLRDDYTVKLGTSSLIGTDGVYTTGVLNSNGMRNITVEFDQGDLYTIDYAAGTITFHPGELGGDLWYSLRANHHVLPTAAQFTRVLHDSSRPNATQLRARTININSQLDKSNPSNLLTLYVLTGHSGSVRPTAVALPGLLDSADKQSLIRDSGPTNFRVDYTTSTTPQYEGRLIITGLNPGDRVELAHNTAFAKPASPPAPNNRVDINARTYYAVAVAAGSPSAAEAVFELTTALTANRTVRVRLEGTATKVASHPAGITILSRANANNPIYRVTDFIDFARDTGAFGSTIARWSVPDNFTYQYRVRTAGTTASNTVFSPWRPLNDGAEINNVLDGLLFDAENRVAHRGVQIRRQGGQTIGLDADWNVTTRRISTGVLSTEGHAVWTIPQPPVAIAAAPAPNLARGTITAANTREYLVLEAGVKIGDTSASTKVIQPWTRVTGGAIQVDPNWAGANLYIRVAATATAPHGLVINDRFRTIPVTAAPQNIPATLQGPNEIGDVFVYNPGTGAIGINPAIPFEILRLGYARNSRIEISNNGDFWFLTPARNDIRSYLAVEHDDDLGANEARLWVRIQGTSRVARSQPVEIVINVNNGAIRLYGTT